MFTKKLSLIDFELYNNQNSYKLKREYLKRREWQFPSQNWRIVQLTAVAVAPSVIKVWVARIFSYKGFILPHE